MNAFLFKKSCCRIVDAAGSSGTGFLVTPDLVLTCKHVVKGSANGDSVNVHFDSRSTTGVIIESDAERDWALVKLADAVAGGKSLKLSPDVPSPEQPGESYGFPSVAGGAGVGIKVVIHQAQGKDQLHRDSLILRSNQLSGSEPQGFSGSPVLVDGLVVGMLRSIIPDVNAQPQFQLVYACPSPMLLAALRKHGISDGAAQETETVDRWTALTIGMPMSAREATRSFLTRYLGTTAHPAPFGGRATELAQLLGWADGDTPPIAMLVAPTGRGKSALLCRLVDRLLSREDLAIAFFPISQRFGTNLAGVALPALVGRLAALFQVAVPKELTPAVVRAWLAQHLRRVLPDGRKLLLIMDGLDEATDWPLEPGAIPIDMPPTNRVLLACRQTVHDEAERLRRRLELPPNLVHHGTVSLLDVLAVQESLRCLESTVGPLWSNPAMVQRFHELSDRGDPLLLELLLEDLLTESGRKTLLSTVPDLKPGLRGIWDRMVTSQEEGVLSSGSPSWRLMSVLVCALAPLTRDSFVELAGLSSAVEFLSAIRPIKRWIHETPSGYVFSHNRIREFLLEELLTYKERRQWEDHLLQWMERQIPADVDAEGELADLPDYVLHCFSAHLERTDAPGNKWAVLLRSPWRRLWESRPLGLVGLARDVNRVIDALTKQNLAASQANKKPPYLPEYLRALLWLASIHTQATNIPADLIKRLVERGKWTPAHALAHLEHRLSIDDTAEDLVTVADTVFGLLPDELLRDGLELAPKLVNARGNHQEKPWRTLFRRAAKIMPQVAAQYARMQRGDWERIMVPLLLSESLPETESGLADSLRQESLVCIERLGAVPLANATLRFMQFFDFEIRSRLLDRAWQKQMDFARSAKHTGILRLLIPLRPHDQQQQAFIDALKIAITCPGPHEIYILLDLLDKIEPAVASAGLSLLLSRGLPGLVDWLLARGELSASERWSRIAKLLGAAEIRKLELATLDAAKARWDSSGNWDISTLLELANRGYQDEIVPFLRSTPDEDKRRFGLLELRGFLPYEERFTVLQNALLVARGYRASRLVDLLLEEHGGRSIEDIERVLDSIVAPSARARGYVRLAGSVPQNERFRLLSKAELLFPRTRNEDGHHDLLLLALRFEPTIERLDAFLAGPNQNICTLLKLAEDLLEPHRRRVQEQIVASIRSSNLWLRTSEIDTVLAADGFPADLAQTLRSIAEEDTRRSPPQQRARALLDLIASHEETEVGALDDVIGNLRLIQDESVRFHLAALFLSSERLLLQLFEQATAVQNATIRFDQLSHLADITEAHGLKHKLAQLQNAAIEAGRSILFDQSRFVRSYVMHLGGSQVRRAVAQEVIVKIEQVFSTHRDTLEEWSSLSNERREDARRALSSSAQQELSDASRMIEEVGSWFTVEEAERLWPRIPSHWLRAREVLLPVLSESTRTQAIQDYQRWIQSMDDVNRAGTVAFFASALPMPEQALATQQALDALHRNVAPDGTLPSNTCVVLSQLARSIQPEHLSSAVALAQKTWPTAYNSLHIFLLRLPRQLRAEAMWLLERDLDSLPKKNRDEVDQTLRLFRIDRDAAVAFLEWEKERDRDSLDRLVQSSQAWTQSQLLHALEFLRARRGGVLPAQDKEVEFQLMAFHLRRDASLRLRLLKLVHDALSPSSKNRSSLLSALNTMAPTLRALTEGTGADALADEVLRVGDDWP